ncbi:hypothetical protein G6052_10280 [Stenotrophomonas maltophilia]|nr:hypothetical protein G6052_10280 [Stenotrophomonas maltophilia]
MDKGGWQVTSGILAMALIGAAFALMATRGVLAQERNDRQACPERGTASQPTVKPHWQIELEQENARRVLPKNIMAVPDKVSCQGGVYLIRTEQGIESLTKDGRAISCHGP